MDEKTIVPVVNEVVLVPNSSVEVRAVKNRESGCPNLYRSVVLGRLLLVRTGVARFATLPVYFQPEVNNACQKNQLPPLPPEAIFH